MKILNLTQHEATPEQIAQGVYDLSPTLRKTLSRLLTFDDLPTCKHVRDVAETIADLARTFCEPDTLHVMIGAPFLMASLEKALACKGFIPLYAFSKRESTEETQADGSVKKIAKFRHVGFVDF